jgi:hypothetical protein
MGIRGQLIREAAVYMHHQALSASLSVCLSVAKSPIIDEAMKIFPIG